jgi:hypothetical protein
MEILRLKPQNDIMTQSQRVEGTNVDPVFSPSPLRKEGWGEGNKGFYLFITDHPTAELT